jgi:hypothetical protein
MVSTGIVFVGFSLGLLACGSGGNSNSNPGLGGTGGAVTGVPPTCQNPIDVSVLNSASAASFDRRTNYTLSTLTVYVYNPSTGDSISVSADSRDSLHVSSRIDCNGAVDSGRHSESVSVPQVLDSQDRDAQDLTLAVNFANREPKVTSSNEPNAPDSLGLDDLGKGRTLIGAETYVISSAVLTQQGLEIVSETQSAPDRTGNVKLIYVSAVYEDQAAVQPTRPQPSPPGDPHR